MTALAEQGLRVLGRRPTAAPRPSSTSSDADRGRARPRAARVWSASRSAPSGYRRPIQAARTRASSSPWSPATTRPPPRRSRGRSASSPGTSACSKAATCPLTRTALGALLDHDGVVISRVTPADKLRIARALQARGHVVAMTGDGVNDGPALQAADIGMAMGRSGTDVARAAADLVLLDDDFSTIVAAMEQGRATFTNIRRFLTYHLTDNVAELTPFVVWALSGGRFPLALGVLQILCLDIGTDLAPGARARATNRRARCAAAAARQRHLIDRPLLVRVFGVLGPAEAFVEMTAFLVALAAAGWRPGDAFPTGHALMAASGAAFAAVVFGQAANAFACRSTTRSPRQLGWTSNRLLSGASRSSSSRSRCSSSSRRCADSSIKRFHRGRPHRGRALAAPLVLGADHVHKAVRERNDRTLRPDRLASMTEIDAARGRRPRAGSTTAEGAHRSRTSRTVRAHARWRRERSSQGDGWSTSTRRRPAAGSPSFCRRCSPTCAGSTSTPDGS